MKYYQVLTGLCCLIMLHRPLKAQISVSPINVESLKEAPFTYKGSRAMMADRVDDSQSQNIYLFSKPDKGTQPDTLYAQKLTKEDGIWQLSMETAIVHDGFISIWNSRKGYIDADQDKRVDAFFIYSLHDATTQAQQSVHLLLFYKKDFYTVGETLHPATGKYGNIVFSDNFKQLPAPVKKEILAYWHTLDKN